MKTAILIVITLVISIVIGVAIVRPLVEFIPSLGNFLRLTPSAQGGTTRTIVNSIQPLGQLVTISVEVAHANVNVTTSTPICGYEAHYVSQSVIEAGVDISNIGEDSIEYDKNNNVYMIQAPAPAITSCRNEYFDQYSKSSSAPAVCFDDFWDDMSIIGRHVSMDRFVKDALESGILRRAENQATIVLGNFISAVTGSLVHIEYEATPAEANVPPSCRLDLPPGWVDDGEGGWKRGKLDE